MSTITTFQVWFFFAHNYLSMAFTHKSLAFVFLFSLFVFLLSFCDIIYGPRMWKVKKKRCSLSQLRSWIDISSLMSIDFDSLYASKIGQIQQRLNNNRCRRTNERFDFRRRKTWIPLTLFIFIKRQLNMELFKQNRARSLCVCVGLSEWLCWLLFNLKMSKFQS